MENQIRIIECPRDAMQGIRAFIPTNKKVKYLQALLNCNFHTLDFGSFVSPKAIPQMQDTVEVLKALDLTKTNTKLLAIVANERGAIDALKHDEISYLGFPFSISENFQMRNTHKSIEESVVILERIIAHAAENNKEVVTYLSMGFGNPYGDPWSTDIVSTWVEKIAQMGVRIISLSDTVGTAKSEDIKNLFSSLIPEYPHIEFGAHLHTDPKSWKIKLEAAYRGGCRRFDGAIKGFGGCPMAMDALTGNMPTEKILSFSTAHKLNSGVNWMAFEAAHNKATDLFSEYH